MVLLDILLYHYEYLWQLRAVMMNPLLIGASHTTLNHSSCAVNCSREKSFVGKRIFPILYEFGHSIYNCLVNSAKKK